MILRKARQLAASILIVIAGMLPITSYAFDADETPLLAVGPALITNTDGLVLSVNGQRIIYDSQTITAIENSSSSDTGFAGIELIQAGDYLVVAGELMGPGTSLATTIVVLDEVYTDGASPTYLRVIVDAISSDGYAFSDATSVDYTGTLYSNELAGLAVGDVVEFSGVNSEGVLVALEGYLGDRDGGAVIDSNILGQRHSGIRGQRHSGLRGQRHSGVRGQRHSGLR